MNPSVLDGFSVACPNCGREGTLKNVKKVPSSVRCPSCKHKFSPQQDPPALADEDILSSDSDTDDTSYPVADTTIPITVHYSGDRPEREPWFYPFLWDLGERIQALANTFWYINVIFYLFGVGVLLTVLESVPEVGQVGVGVPALAGLWAGRPAKAGTPTSLWVHLTGQSLETIRERL